MGFFSARSAAGGRWLRRRLVGASARRPVRRWLRLAPGRRCATRVGGARWRGALRRACPAPFAQPRGSAVSRAARRRSPGRRCRPLVGGVVAARWPMGRAVGVRSGVQPLFPRPSSLQAERNTTLTTNRPLLHCGRGERGPCRLRSQNCSAVWTMISKFFSARSDRTRP